MGLSEHEVNQIKKYEWFGIVFFVLAGTIIHWMFEWTNYFTPFAWLWPVNESYWEHAKMSFYPLIIWTLIEVRKLAPTNLWKAKAVELLVLLFFHQILFYVIYNSIDFNGLGIVVEIITSQVIFIMGFIIGQYISIRLILSDESSKMINIISKLFIVLNFGFIIFSTYYTPELPLFWDPINEVYGIIIPDG